MEALFIAHQFCYHLYALARCRVSLNIRAEREGCMSERNDAGLSSASGRGVRVNSETSSVPSKPVSAAKERAEHHPVEQGPFPMVGIGVSADGLGSLTQLLGALPTTTGMAFIVVRHL